MSDPKESASSPLSASANDGEVATSATSPAHGEATGTNTTSSGPPATEELPSPETARKIEEYQVLDHEGKKHTFKSLYENETSTDRVLVIFIRHFFCGSCQGYIIDLSQAIRPDDLLRLPTPTSIAIVGCGDPGLIDFYATETGCSFPIYADPTGKLYDELGMSKNLALGPQPGYIHKGILRTAGESMLKALKHISTGLILKGGESRQNGGELIFESTGGVQEKQMTWCHRMKTTRDHIEIDELIGILDPSRQYLKKSKE